MTDVIMPKMGDGMEEGILLEWLKKDGDTVSEGEVIGSIQTDKATLELEAPASGKLTGLLIKNGDSVPVGKSIAAILQSGESLPSDWKGGAGQAPAVSESATAKSQPEPASAQSSSSSQRIKASPLAKKIAAKRGVDLTSVQGTGPGGRIVQVDVLRAEESKPAAAATSPKPVPKDLPKAVPTGSDVLIPLTRMKKITGDRTLQAKLTAPHIYVTISVEMDAILELRAAFERDETTKPSLNDFIIKASALSLRDMPLANSSLTESGILQHANVNIGIAAAIEDGLTVPVLKNADLLSLGQISVGAKELVKKAKENKLSLDELSGSTFSISNMGMMNVDSFCAIINPPNVAILAIGSAKKVVVPNPDGSFGVKTVMAITGSFDHRVIDGADGAKFLNLVRQYLEHPTRMLV